MPGALGIPAGFSMIMNEFLQRCGSAAHVRKASAFLDLTPMEKRALLALGQDLRPVMPGEVVLGRDERANGICVLLSGALSEGVMDADGRQQALRFHFPGDAVGGAALVMDRHAHEVRALTPATVSFVSREKIRQWGDGRLYRLFMAFRLAEAQIMADRLRMVGRSRADERLLHFVLEINARQRLTVPAVGDRAWLPFSQSLLGDAIGLTNVYVSKTMSVLRERGDIETDGHVVTLCRRAQAARRVEFVDRYRAIDVSYLNASAQEPSMQPLAAE